MANNSIVNIKDYFSRHNGLQRSNRYKVKFGGIEYFGIDGNNEYQARSAVIGSRAIDCVSDNLTGYGTGRVIPRYQKFVGGVFLVFPVTNDSHILTLFNNWFNRLHSGSRSAYGGGGLGVRYITDFYDDAVFNVTMDVELLDPNGGVNSTFRFYEVMPIETMPIELNMMENNAYSVYQVLINYKEFTFYPSATN
jgi:hypothetical protein